MDKMPFNLKSISVGFLLGILVVFCDQYSINIFQSDWLAGDHLPAIGIFFIFLLCLFLNPLLKLLSRNRVSFSRAELLVIYVMVLTAGSVSTAGTCGFLLPMLVGVRYFATPINRWEELILPHLKDWLVPKDMAIATAFYEGAATIPWLYWLKILIPWMLFLSVFFFTTICIISLLRRRWVEKENLNFALNTLVLSITEEPKPCSLVGDIFKNRLMWIGFVIAFLYAFSGVLHYYLPIIPSFKKYSAFPIFRGTTSLSIAISFPIIGFIFFVNSKLSMSLWVFAIFFTILEGYLNIIGAHSMEYLGAGSFNAAGGPVFAHLCFGALTAYVLYSLFVARTDFRDAFRKSIGRGKGIDDSRELMSYPSAFWGLLLGYIFLVGFLTAAGMSLWVAGVFLLLVYLVVIGLTKVVAQGGLLSLKTPSLASSQLTSMVGSARLGPDNMANLGLSYIYHSKLRTMPMVAAIHSAKLGERIRKNIRPLFWLIMLMMVMSMIFSNILLLMMAYRYGAINLNVWMTQAMAQFPWQLVSNHLRYPSSTIFSGIWLKAAGFLTMVLLTMAYNSLGWFPFHPLGFAVASTYRVMHPWFSIFLGWSFQVLIIKFGGPRVYNSSKPFFLGLILGTYGAAGIWFAIQLLVPGMPPGLEVFYV